ncbi:MAG: ABC transporter ATP-binding protein [Pseudomonadota bacterium]
MAYLNIDQISKTFGEGDDAVEAVTPVSLGIEKGTFVVFLGPSGCGKTTLMRIVGGLESASAGTITLEGEPLSGPDRRRGMVFQSYAAFPWLTVEGNIRLALRYRPGLDRLERSHIARNLIDLVGLSGFEKSYLNQISGGMRQRVAIARTLAADPDVLLMDEPFGALDALTREHLQTQLLRIHREAAKTTIFVTHDVDEALLLADRVIVFSSRPARIVEDLDVVNSLGRERGQAMRDTSEFIALRRHVQDRLRAEYAAPEKRIA